MLGWKFPEIVLGMLNIEVLFVRHAGKMKYNCWMRETFQLDFFSGDVVIDIVCCCRSSLFDMYFFLSHAKLRDC